MTCVQYNSFVHFIFLGVSSLNDTLVLTSWAKPKGWLKRARRSRGAIPLYSPCQAKSTSSQVKSKSQDSQTLLKVSLPQLFKDT